ncbi:MAG TPA: DUF2254 domain-containing protein [Tepidisphaeraceae bacterium]|nr:DUF2254 domain-containing protein [Tepidisphaeraceae bacterium]
MKNHRLPLVFRHAVYTLRGGFLVRPLVMALSLGCAGAVFSWLEELFPGASAWAPSVLFPSRADPQVAQVILSGIASSIMTVVSIVFAILLMTLTLASMQFSPRIIVSFSRDRVTQRTLGIFLGTFCYCMAALPAARSMPTPFAPVATVFGAMILAVACVGWLLFFIHHISHAISVNFIVDRIAAETEAVIDETMPAPRTPRQAHGGAVASIKWDRMILSDESGYIRFVEVDRLMELARTYQVRVQVLRRVGHFVPAGVPLMRISGADRMPPEGGDAFRGAFDIGPSRTLQQDVEFGVLQIVDIALRAISPAVNDPSTAINGIDQLSRILIRYAARQEPESVLFDLPGEARVIVPWISFEGLLESAFDQIRHYAAHDRAVCLRLLRALGDIAVSTQDDDCRQSTIDRARRIVADCQSRLSDDDVAAMRVRLASVQTLTPIIDAAIPRDYQTSA